MPRKKLAVADKMDYYIMVRFPNKDRAVIEQAVADSKQASPSEFVRELVSLHCRYLTDAVTDEEPF